MDDLEQQCEDALFELCDARERYPLRCADEFQKSIKLQNDINMLKVFQKINFTEALPAVEQDAQPAKMVKADKTCFDHLDDKLQNIMNKFDNLKAVMDQIERERTCLTNKLLEG